MAASVNVGRLEEHANAFGFLRLVLASLVIASHSPELADNNRGREILTQAFGTVSFGELAVDGFFLISGYLIVRSFAKRPKVIPYLIRRSVRIYPAFITASLICLLIVAPLGGARLSEIVSGIPRSVLRMALLDVPVASRAFVGSYYPQLDSSMWTISYEFFCYLIVIPLGLCGVFKKPAIIASMAISCLILFSVINRNDNVYTVSKFYLIGAIPLDLNNTVKFVGIFLIGSIFFLYKNQIKFNTSLIFGSATGLLLTLFIPTVAEMGVAIFGGYLIFATAALGSSSIISRINNRNDISYGIYLYAWPVEKLLMWYWPGIPVLVAGIATLIISCVCGWISWHAVEKPAIDILIGHRFK